VTLDNQRLVLSDFDSLVKKSAPENTGPKFIGLHWEPIASTDDSALSQSIWGQIVSSTSDPVSLDSKEFHQLSIMFAKKSTSDKSQEVVEEAVSCEVVSADQSTPASKKLLKRKSSLPTTIDMSRSTNISIGLASFRQKRISVETVSTSRIDMTYTFCSDIILHTHRSSKRSLNMILAHWDKKIFSG
jgi:hypothetical protein